MSRYEKKGNAVLKIIKQKSNTNKYKSQIVVKSKRGTRCIIGGTNS